MSKKNANPMAYLVGIIAALIISIFVFSMVIENVLPGPIHGTFDLYRALEFKEAFEFLKLILTTVNAILLVYLLYNYVSVYLEVRSQFSIGLIVIASALLAHTIAANPAVSLFFGFHTTGLGPFDVIPSFFTLIAALVLIYLSNQ